MAQKGTLSINSENIFPIIKKWMYSDQDIFVREEISNACDAITKLEKLSLIGEWTKPADYKGRVDVIVDSEHKTVTFQDNGIGMTAEEVEKYINQIAFSGATDFINKYKDKANDDQIIGHFGLGFYSVFMVADQVDIDTLSYKQDATPIHWTCNGGTEYEMTDGDKKTIGTTITLHLNDDCLKYDNEWEMREIIEKYCSFMPVEIYITKLPKETETIQADQKKDSDVVVEEIPEKVEKDAEGKETKTPAKLKIEKRPQLLNDTHPLWGKTPSECTKEEYIDFYHKVFRDYKEPLFWIHLNMDYPYNLKGILYFPKINTEYDSIEGTIKLYNNQVFIADNIKEVIPEFLMLLKGVIDCPDLPLNVSRSALQNDGFVKKISDYITKKVADKLTGMCKTDRENYEKYWDDISPFIKFGCIKDSKFGEKMADSILYKNLDGKYLTIKDLVKEEEAAKADSTEAETKTEDTASAEEKKDESSDENKEPEKTTIYYVTDEIQQSQYINMFREAGMDAVILKHNIDNAFISHMEQLHDNIKFQRIDADVTDTFKEETDADALKETTDTLTDVFRKALGNDKLTVKVEKLKNANVSSMMTLSEENRRMQEMMKMYGMAGMDPSMFGNDVTLVLNANNKLVQYVAEHKDDEHVPMICEQLYDLAMIAHKTLNPDEMTKFIARSNEILELLAEK